MARRRIARRRPKRRSARRARRSRASIPMIMKRNQRVKLTYTEILSRTGLTNFDSYQFRLNSIYDPDVTGGGHQVMGRDQWATLYAHYRVYKAVVQVDFSAGTSEIVTCGLTPFPSTASLSDGVDAIENPKSKWVSVNVGSGPRRIVKTYYPANIMGLTSAQYKANEDCSAAIASNPANAIYLNMWADYSTGSAFAYQATLKITYFCELYSPILLTTS